MFLLALNPFLKVHAIVNSVEVCGVCGNKRKMPASYSLDFRKKIIEYVTKGNSYNKASIKFTIASNTVRDWVKRYKAQGHYLSRKVGEE